MYSVQVRIETKFNILWFISDNGNCLRNYPTGWTIWRVPWQISHILPITGSEIISLSLTECQFHIMKDTVKHHCSVNDNVWCFSGGQFNIWHRRVSNHVCLLALHASIRHTEKNIMARKQNSREDDKGCNAVHSWGDSIGLVKIRSRTHAIVEILSIF